MNHPILIFDLETIPDIDTGKKLYPSISHLEQDDAYNALMALRQAEAGNDFMRLPLHKIACLSFLWVENGNFTLRSLSLDKMDEAQILTTFLRAFYKKPMLVSWNGASFDLPVLMYRMTHHQINASVLCNAGVQKYDYFNRYSEKHVDLMDKFSFGAWNGKQKLDTIASLCGFVGKGDIDGSQVLPMVQAQQWDKLTAYCESDVLNTWLIYLRWQLLTGKLSHEQVDKLSEETKRFIQTLKNEDDSPRHSNF